MLYTEQRELIKNCSKQIRGEDNLLTYDEFWNQNAAIQVSNACNEFGAETVIIQDYSNISGTLVWRVELKKDYDKKMASGGYSVPEMDFWRIYIVPPLPKNPEDIHMQFPDNSYASALALIDRYTNPMPTTIRFSRPVSRDEVEKYILWEINKEAGLTEIPTGSFWIPFRPFNANPNRGYRGIDTLDPVDIDAILAEVG